MNEIWQIKIKKISVIFYQVINLQKIAFNNKPNAKLNNRD